jgi:hypothetical protein
MGQFQRDVRHFPLRPFLTYNRLGRAGRLRRSFGLAPQGHQIDRAASSTTSVDAHSKEPAMIQIPWTALISTAEAADSSGPDWLRAEFEERIQLGDRLVVTDIPPTGDTKVFDNPANFRRWLSSRVKSPESQ